MPPELRLARIALREHAVLFAPDCASGARSPLRPELRFGSTQSSSPRIALREHAVLFASLKRTNLGDYSSELRSRGLSYGL
ncbi:MAG: hypothetical protein AB9861_20740 [Methanosarcina sp.]